MLVQVLEEEKKTVLFVYEEIQYVVRHGDLVFIMQIKINRSIQQTVRRNKNNNRNYS